jgi:hypothetical protein
VKAKAIKDIEQQIIEEIKTLNLWH